MLASCVAAKNPFHGEIWLHACSPYNTVDTLLRTRAKGPHTDTRRALQTTSPEPGVRRAGVKQQQQKQLPPPPPPPPPPWGEGEREGRGVGERAGAITADATLCFLWHSLQVVVSSLRSSQSSSPSQTHCIGMQTQLPQEKRRAGHEQAELAPWLTAHKQKTTQHGHAPVDATRAGLQQLKFQRNLLLQASSQQTKSNLFLSPPPPPPPPSENNEKKFKRSI